MKSQIKILSLFVIIIAIVNCSPKKQADFKPKEVYKSENLIVKQISPNSFAHISFLQTQDFGNVPCNGLIVRNGNEVVVFDTPTNTGSSEELIKWITDTLHCKINAIIPTHFHNDCLAGLKAFDENEIPSYAYFKTIELARLNNLVVPKNSFSDSLVLKLGDEIIAARFFGEGHTKDNIVGYYPHENVLFGGCLVKELTANKGYLGDANTEAWPGTVEKLLKEYPDASIVVPGHGETGGRELLAYTINLFKK